MFDAEEFVDIKFEVTYAVDPVGKDTVAAVKASEIPLFNKNMIHFIIYSYQSQNHNNII